MIYRAEKEKGNFTQIHKDLINDKNLSPAAKGIMLYLLSQCDEWQFYELDIKNHFSVNLEQIRKGIKELVDYGLLIRTKMHIKGKFVYEYEVYETKKTREEFE